MEKGGEVVRVCVAGREGRRGCVRQGGGGEGGHEERGGMRKHRRGMQHDTKRRDRQRPARSHHPHT